ncbi:MAG TPA: OmpA family protein, partial [bacterium]|nr:OmpA family protein [bacterium]
HYFGLNLGLRLRESETFLNLDVAHEVLWGGVYQVSIAPDADFSGFVEAQGATVLQDFFQNENTIPLEARLGFTKGFLAEHNLKTTIFGGLGVTSGFNTPDARVGLKITYDHLVSRVETREVVKVVEPKMVRIEKELKELTIYYPTDGDKVDPFYDQKIAAIAAILRDNPDLGPLYIVGHTDDVGSHGYNQRLSERRAGKSARSIMDNGLSDKQIVWVGMGEIYPVVPNTSDANRALNRRTLFTFVKPQQLQEQYTKAGSLIGINTITGKQNDSYTEVLKKLETQKQFVDDASGAQVIENYRDSSQVILEQDGTTTTKDSPAASPQVVPNQPRSKTVVETKIETHDEALQRVETEALEEPQKTEKPKKEKKAKARDQKKSLIEEIDVIDEEDVMDL